MIELRASSTSSALFSTIFSTPFSMMMHATVV
jgi:hypothetical protein